jgi:8-oxo-dGTP diphosphatase
MKQTQFAVAAVVIHPTNTEEVLAVKRPLSADSLSNVWGFPAIVVEDGELPEAAIKRLGIEKLATDIETLSCLGIKYTERSTYHLILMDIPVRLLGREPSVRDSRPTGIKYVDQKWTSDYSIFKEAASKGSLCSQIFLASKGISWD